ncbi:hypothetical protein [Streptomyces sp. NBC_00620]|uniref:hypothetical protein n=1 Tax=Streptomyces sp. NBC_00620 TaxID=2903666 RepID=UPI002256E4A9|nr:hypothetical protein [Streptomyces sp. NBC_00620]MCX4976256.1 hypothetical protein [Streptomyces sp. NBC_00620]
MNETAPSAGDDDDSGDERKVRRWIARFLAYLLLLPAVFCYVAAHLWFPSGETHSAAIALGESFLVASVLGIGGDFYLKQKLSEASERRGIARALAETFGFLDPNQPPELKSAVEDFANEKLYYKWTRWRMTFDWVDPETKEILALRLDLSGEGVALARAGLRFRKPLWILRSVDGFQSAYTYYSLHCPQSDVNVDEDEEAIKPFSPETKAGDSRVLLEHADLINAKSPAGVIAYQNKFSMLRRARMYRHSTDYVPLAHGTFAIAFTLEFDGDALPDLTVSAFTPKSSQNDEEWVSHGRETDPRKFSWYNVTPNQATIVSWRRKDDALGSSEADLAGQSESQ